VHETPFRFSFSSPRGSRKSERVHKRSFVLKRCSLHSRESTSFPGPSCELLPEIWRHEFPGTDGVPDNLKKYLGAVNCYPASSSSSSSSRHTSPPRPHAGELAQPCRRTGAALPAGSGPAPGLARLRSRAAGATPQALKDLAAVMLGVLHTPLCGTRLCACRPRAAYNADIGIPQCRSRAHTCNARNQDPAVSQQDTYRATLDIRTTQISRRRSRRTRGSVAT